MPKKPGFTYIDLFAGIGCFHAALGALGGQCVYASEIDTDAARIYQRNWGIQPDGDITLSANENVMNVPEHDVLVAGFPCQPFSKSGKQLGMEETRGTLFWNIARIIEVRKPSVVLLENVRNIAGPRHTHEWNVIIQTLRSLGYRVSSVPLVVSPHKINPEFGGRPQIRERVLIAATRDESSKSNMVIEPEQLNIRSVFENWDPKSWNLKKHLPLSTIKNSEKGGLALTESELRWVAAWDDFVVTMRKKLKEGSLPGFPIWVDDWIESDRLEIPSGTPKWKENFLVKNSDFYTLHKKVLDSWLKRWDGLADFPPSRRKFEWQAQDAKDLWSTIMHFRPSGIRAKKPTYVPALVAITQTTVIGSMKRRISTREGARLQGLPEWFDFIDQTEPITYKQLGNAVNVGVVYNVLKAQVTRDIDLLSSKPELVRSILGSSPSPDTALSDHKNFVDQIRKSINSEKPHKQGRLAN